MNTKKLAVTLPALASGIITTLALGAAVGVAVLVGVLALTLALLLWFGYLTGGEIT